jgi:hypothetical protein
MAARLSTAPLAWASTANEVIYSDNFYLW